MCSKRDAGGEPIYTIWCSLAWPGKSTAGTSFALIFGVRILRRGLPSLWAVPSILRRYRIRTERRWKRAPSTRSWSQPCWRRVPTTPRSSDGESSKPAEKFRVSARSAKLVRARYGKHPDPRGGRKQSNSIPRPKPPNLNRYLQLHQYLQL